MNYTPGETSYGDKYNTIGSSKELSKPFSFAESSYQDTTKYSTLNTKTSHDTTESMYTPTDTKFNTIGGKYQEKSAGYLGTTSFGTELKYSPGSRDGKTSGSSYDTSPNVTVSSSSMLLSVEDTPTPTSSIETEDSNTREVGEKDVEGDGEQSD